MEISRERLLWLYEKMVQIRRFEERALKEYSRGKIPGSLHLYIGMEAVAVGVCAYLGDGDFVTSTHRGHGHCIAKGVEIRPMMAELFGKSTGICRGKGGSMHVSDFSKGMLGAIPIVGAGAPLACGSALMAKYKGTDQVTACFFGDGASNQGGVLESFNLAAIWKLPIIFVCENNLYAESTPILYSQAAEHVADKVCGFGIPGSIVDGMDVFAVYEAANDAVNWVKSGKGPILLECMTYRYCGHFHGDTQTYQLSEEMERFRARDCIEQFKKNVIAKQWLTAEHLAQIDAKVEAEIEQAVQFAEDSAYPTPEETLTDVYVSYPKR